MNTDYHAIASEFLGIPYINGGRTKEGLDCIGLVHLFCERCGVEIPDSDGSEYPLDWYWTDPDRFLRGLRQIGREVPPHHLQPLDLVYFKIGPGVTHVGVMLDSRQFLHVMIRQVVHVTPLNFRWWQRLAGVRRVTD